MKKNTIIAALSAASALLLCASCQKQELIEQNNGNASGKTFTATIEQSLTKTTITNEYKVNWVEGDQIDINGSIFSATPDASDATKASLTKVSGSDPAPDYTAVYPASIMVSTQPTLPATQTYAEGRFNAPMCAMSSKESLEFKNFCGVLCFALKGTDKVKSIAVTANEQLCGPFEFADATSFSFTGENEGYTVTLDCGEGVQLSSTDSTNFYVYLPPKDSYTAGMKIVVTSTEGKTFEKTTTTAVKIERNNLYTFDWTASFSPAEPEYVEIGGLKWATKNLGAEKVTDYGDYFAWGETAPYYVGTGGWPTTPAWKEGKTSGYKWDSYCGQSSFVEWSTPPYDATTKILKPEFDAAAQILGDGWRMPTSAEFQALYDACLNGSYDTSTNPSGASAPVGKGVYWCTSYDGVKGCLFCDGTNKLFFPAAGHGNGTSLYTAGSNGYYWSSTWYSSDYAYYLYFNSSNVDPQSNIYRCLGRSVRPVKAAAAPLPAGALSGEFSVSATKKVHFSQGNLTYNVSTTTWAFYEHQYDCATGYDSKLISLFTWGYDATKSIVPDGTNYVEGHTTNGEPFSNTEDWGYVFGGESSVWRTLSKDDWTYLFNTRTMTNGKDRYSNALTGVTIGGATYKGVFLYPDNYNGEVVSNSMTWDAINAAGIVFLPAAGCRYGSDVFDVDVTGLYWSSTAYRSGDAYNVRFSGSTVTPGYDDYRDNCSSVRLVTEVK